jgi:hypothetical protein
VPSRADFADPGVAEQSKHPCQSKNTGVMATTCWLAGTIWCPSADLH